MALHKVECVAIGRLPERDGRDVLLVDGADVVAALGGFARRGRRGGRARGGLALALAKNVLEIKRSKQGTKLVESYKKPQKM